MSLLFVLFSLVGCKKDEEVVYVQFNADGDDLSIEVGAELAADPVSIDLHSTTGEVVVGRAEVTPAAGPVGTEHVIVVEIANAYENVVDRVSVRTKSDGRGEDEYDLDPDSADEGYYKLTLVSVGSEDETRTDTLTIRCWDIEGDEDAEGPADSGAL